MAYVPNSGSVVAFQSDPTKLVATVSVVGTIAVGGGSVTAIPTGNQSVSGTVQTDVRGSVATVIIGGSIAASFTPPANQSVSGTVQTELLSTDASVIVVGTFAPAANQSVSGTVNVGNFPTSQNVSGSVVAFQGTSPWAVANGGSIITVSKDSSVIAYQLAGSILAVEATIVPPANQSVSGTVNVGNFPANQSVSGAVTAPPGSVMNTVSPAGSVTAISGAVTAPAGSVMNVVNPAGSITAISGTVTANAGTVPGSVVAFPGTVPWPVVNVGSIISTPIGSIIVVLQSSSIIARVTGSVATLGIAGSITTVVNPAGSVGTVAVNNFPTNQNVSGSVVAFGTMSVLGTVPVTQSGTWQPSALGYLTRNDAIASFAGANLTTRPVAGDSAGRMLIKPFAPGESSLISTASTVNFGTTTPASIRLFLAPGAGLKNYVTDFNFSNTGATTTLVSIVDEDASVMGRTIVPAGGGSNHSFATPLTTQIANKQVGVIAASATSVLHITLTGYKAP